MRKIIPEFDRFISKVSQADTGCWEWLGSKYRFGYGQFRRKVNGKWTMYKCHRFAYEHFKGPIPQGAFVCHTCDNPGCVNPAHLFSGSAHDNVHDMFNKGRKSKIIRNPRHRLLSLDIAKEIRLVKKHNPSYKLDQIASMFNTSKAQVSRILLNQIWSEVN